MIDLYRDRTALVRRGFQRFGPVFGLRIGRRPAAVLIGPDLHQTFFEQTDKALSMDRPYQFIAACFGRVGFLAPPEVYNDHRPIIHLPFKAAKTASHLRVMQTETEAFLAALPERGELVLNDSILEIVRNVAAHALMGKAFRDASGDFWEHYQVLSDALDPVLPERLPFPKFVRRDRARRKLRTLVQPLIDARRADPAGHDDFLSEFVNARMKDGRPLSDDDVVSLVTAMVFAGHETTAGQATWTLVHLMQHPEYHARLRAEVDAALPPGTEIDAATLATLSHAHWAVAETSRLCPSVSMMFRQANQDMLVGGYRIPEGWVVLTSPPVAQRLPEIFPDPDRYDPFRFSPGRDEDHAHRFSIISFGGAIHDGRALPASSRRPRAGVGARRQDHGRLPLSRESRRCLMPRPSPSPSASATSR